MKTTKKLFRNLLVVLMVTSFSTLTFAANDMAAKKSAKKTVVEIAIDDDRFSILVDAVSKAGLVDALSAEGPYTVFAPTNDAFEMLFKDLGVNGVEDLTADQLKPILLYHVLSGKVMAEDVKSGKVATLNQDAWMTIDAGKSGVMIDGSSKVIIADVEGSNGVIHAINKVLVPETKTAKASKSSGGCN
jgi:transforming growth factor-beta-induced protein